jgi:hypothetical protein
MNVNFTKWKAALKHGEANELAESLQETVEVIERCIEIINRNGDVFAQALQDVQRRPIKDYLPDFE